MNKNIDIEMMDECKETVLSSIETLFKECINQMKVTDNWNIALIIIFKEGDPHFLASYRPVRLLSQMYELLTKTITKQANKKARRLSTSGTSCFSEGFSTYDHLLT